MHLVFVTQGSMGSAAPQTPNQPTGTQLPGAPGLEENGMAQTALRFGGGLVLGLVLLACGKPSFADVEDVVIPVSQLKKRMQLNQRRTFCTVYFARLGNGRWCRRSMCECGPAASK